MSHTSTATSCSRSSVGPASGLAGAFITSFRCSPEPESRDICNSGQEEEEERKRRRRRRSRSYAHSHHRGSKQNGRSRVVTYSRPLAKGTLCLTFVPHQDPAEFRPLYLSQSTRSKVASVLSIVGDIECGQQVLCNDLHQGPTCSANSGFMSFWLTGAGEITCCVFFLWALVTLTIPRTPMKIRLHRGPK